MQKYCILFLSFIFFLHNDFIGQNPFPTNKHQFRAPLDIKMLLSGNFAELRGNHFHAGIDIKTKGQTGHKIFAVEDGYISRIKISPYGYGNALYIRHPNGYTSVYGHLDCFNIHIEQYVSEEQYKKKSFAVDLFPKANLITVAKGDVIALSGNTGSSMGPHLHFEIRKTATEVPQNPLLWIFDIEDNIAPRIHGLYLYPLSRKSSICGKQNRVKLNVKKFKGEYRLTKQTPILVSDTIGFSLFANDYLNNSHNPCGIYNLVVKADGRIIYQLKLDEMPFTESRYILSHMDYDLKVNSKINVHKCFVDEGNELSCYTKEIDNGRLFVAPGEKKKIEIIADDVYGNSSKLTFEVKGTDPTLIKSIPTAVKVLYPKQKNHFQDNNIVLDFPRDALYSKLYLRYKEKPSNLFYSNLHIIHNKNTPLHKYYNLKIKTNITNKDLKDKLYLARVYKNGKTSIASSKVSFDEDWAVMRTREFGTFALAADTIPPKITLKNISRNKDMTNETGISIKIKDEETGIESYNGYINGTWVLFQYNPKKNLIHYEFDDKMPKGESFKLELVISDSKNNTATKTVNFRKSTPSL